MEKHEKHPFSLQNNWLLYYWKKKKNWNIWKDKVQISCLRVDNPTHLLANQQYFINELDFLRASFGLAGFALLSPFLYIFIKFIWSHEGVRLTSSELNGTTVIVSSQSARRNYINMCVGRLNPTEPHVFI